MQVRGALAEDRVAARGWVLGQQVLGSVTENLTPREQQALYGSYSSGGDSPRPGHPTGLASQEVAGDNGRTHTEDHMATHSGDGRWAPQALEPTLSQKSPPVDMLTGT